MSVGSGEIDVLCEFAINFLLSGQGDAKRLAVALVKAAPTRAPLEVIFVLASAAASIEEVLAGTESKAMALDTWRTASLLGVELHMMQVMGLPNGSCADLLHYWQTQDPYFLNG
jgi:hypothetical protein